MVDAARDLAAAAAQLQHRDADAAHVDARDMAGARRQRWDAERRAREMRLRPLDEIGRSAEQRRHAGKALGGGARIERRLGLATALAGVPREAAERQHLAG